MAYDDNAFLASLFGGAGHFDYPDYTQLLQQWMQPYQIQYDADLGAAGARNQAAMQIARNRYGQGPMSILARLKDAYKETTRSLDEGHGDALRQITNTLAARGILRSGETVWQNKRENDRYKRLTAQNKIGYERQRYDANNQLLDYLQNLQQQYADQQRSGLMGLQEQKMNIGGMLPDLYQPSWVEGDLSFPTGDLAPWSPLTAPRRPRRPTGTAEF